MSWIVYAFLVVGLLLSCAGGAALYVINRKKKDEEVDPHTHVTVVIPGRTTPQKAQVPRATGMFGTRLV